jgi:hypothetical protein
LDVLSAWERSGLSQAEFCRRRGVKGVTFAWWKRRLRQSRAGLESRRPSESPRFVEVRLAGSSASYEVVLAGGRSIRVPASFEAESLSRLIAAVESC